METYSSRRHTGKTVEQLRGIAGLVRKAALVAPPARKTQIRNVARRLGRDTITQLVADYDSGTLTTRLMQRYGIGKQTVLNLLAEQGVKMRRQQPSSDVVMEAAELYRGAASIAAIAERLDVSYTALRHALHAAGVPIRPRGGSRERAVAAHLYRR